MRRPFHLAAIGLLAAAGCLSGSYNDDFRGSLQRYRQEGEFQRLHREPQAFADGRLALRVPQVFNDQDDTGAKPRSKPPFLQDFPGFRIAYEKLVKVDGVQFPAVLSVGVPTDKESSLDDLKKRILSQVEKERSFSKPTWAAAEGQPDGGGKAAWSVLKLAGSQPFDRINENVEEKNNIEGETQIWVASDPDTRVAAVLVWRVPQEANVEVPVNELAGLVARTVEFRQPAEPAPADAAPAAAPAAP